MSDNENRSRRGQFSPVSVLGEELEGGKSGRGYWRGMGVGMKIGVRVGLRMAVRITNTQLTASQIPTRFQIISPHTYL